MEIEKVDQQPKKQIRRRLHSSKPYQERLMNMAEARREIATALKFHRASMKQNEAAAAAGNYYIQSPPLEQQSNFVHYHSTPTAPTDNSYWSMSTPVPPPPPPLNYENLNLVLPNQTLGLNLSFKDFNNLNIRIYHTPKPVYSSASASSSTTTSSSASKEVAVANFPRVTQGGLHNDMDSEHHQEDVKAANSEENDGYHHPYEQVMEFPPWLINSNETSCFQYSDHHFSDEYSPDPALPW